MAILESSPPRDILVVDDENFTRRLLVRALEAIGFACRDCAETEAAMASIERQPPGLLLLDFSMPEQDGAQFSERIRSHANKTIAQIPIIMMTGLAGDAQEIHCLESGADDFVTKPVNAAVLKARIETHLRLSALRQQLERQNAELARWRATIERDLEAARLTQQAIIPHRLPKLPQWDLAAHYQPVIQVGGDVYDWQVMADGRWLLWIADATGHGAAAALLTALAKLLFRHAAAQSHSPAEILRLVNVDLRQIFRGRQVMTAMAVALDPATGGLSVSGAGHPPLFVARAGGEVDEFGSQTPPLGLREGNEPSETPVEVSPGDAFLLITDGFYGLTNAGGERLELAMLRQFAREARAGCEGASDFLQGMLERVRAFAGRTDFPDDMAALAAWRIT